MKSIKFFSLFFLIFSIAHRSFAVDESQALAPENRYPLTIQHYSQCLIAIASAEDLHGLYSPETMSREILQRVLTGEEKPHLLYGIAHGIDPQLPMQGLTELDAMRCCNWMETSLQSDDPVTSSTETGSYILHEDGSFEVNDQAQLYLLPHDDGTFEIISKVTKKTFSPLMMFPKEKTRQSSREGKKNRPGTFPDLETQTDYNRREAETSSKSRVSQQNSSHFGMNITLQSLASILHNENFDDDSLIGYTSSADSRENYVVIKNYLWCLPDIIKACLTPEETRQQVQAARQQVRKHLLDAMLKSDGYKKSFSDGISRQVPIVQPDLKKIDNNLQIFDQFFTDYNFTKGRLENFCTQHNIRIPEPATGRIQKVCPNRSSSIYGPQDPIQQNVGPDRLEYEEKTLTEKTRLTAHDALARALQQQSVNCNYTNDE